MRYAWIALAGAAGAVSRYVVGDLVMRNREAVFPIGTLVVNLSGSFLLAFVFTALTDRFLVSPSLRGALTIGFLGAYTTFSTFSLETLNLLEDGALGLGLANVVLSVVGGLAAAWLGLVAGRAV